jgi:hypothetical protein
VVDEVAIMMVIMGFELAVKAARHQLPPQIETCPPTVYKGLRPTATEVEITQEQPWSAGMRPR